MRISARLRANFLWRPLMIKSLFLRTALGAVIGAGLMTLGAAPAAASVADGVAQIQDGKYADAMRTFKKEAAKDNGDAMYYIGDMLRSGLGQKSAPLEATFWWEKGAYLGNEKCQIALSHAYRNGIGVKLDARQAMIWDREAAKNGSAIAFKNLGDYFATGNGVEIDSKEAAKWYYRASKGGFPAGYVALANLLKDGDGVEKNPVAAYVLYEAASKPVKNFEPERNAAADARLLGHKLSAADLERAKKLTVEEVLESLERVGEDQKK